MVRALAGLLSPPLPQHPGCLGRGHQLVCRCQNLVRGASQLRGPEEEGEQVPGGALGGEGQSGPVGDGRFWLRAWFESSHTAPAGGCCPSLCLGSLTCGGRGGWGGVSESPPHRDLVGIQAHDPGEALLGQHWLC